MSRRYPPTLEEREAIERYNSARQIRHEAFYSGEAQAIIDEIDRAEPTHEELVIIVRNLLTKVAT